MPYFVDLHTHTYHSVDGTASPRQLVDSAKQCNPAISQMALSNHNTFAGCEEFLAVCAEYGIEGFASAEVSGSHPDLPAIEFHFLTNFGTAWSDAVRRRADLLTPHLNRVVETNSQNVMVFLHAAARQGLIIDYRDVVHEALRLYHNQPEPRDITMVSPPDFWLLRRLLRSRPDIEEPTTSGRTELEIRIWRQAGMQPVCSPPITEAYAAYRQARPAVTLAHPMRYGLAPAELRPWIQEWQREIGLIALETHYGNVFYPEWKELADSLGLLSSPGSDRHGVYVAGNPQASVPVIEDGQADIPPLLDALRAAG